MIMWLKIARGGWEKIFMMVNLGNQSLSESLQTCVFAARRPWAEILCNMFVSVQQDLVFHVTAGVSMSRTMSLLYVALFVIALLCKSSFSLNLTCGDALCVRDKLNANDSQNEDLTTRSPYHFRRSVGKLTSTQDPRCAKWLLFV